MIVAMALPGVPSLARMLAVAMHFPASLPCRDRPSPLVPLRRPPVSRNPIAIPRE